MDTKPLEELRAQLFAQHDVIEKAIHELDHAIEAIRVVSNGDPPVGKPLLKLPIGKPLLKSPPAQPPTIVNRTVALLRENGPMKLTQIAKALNGKYASISAIIAEHVRKQGKQSKFVRTKDGYRFRGQKDSELVPSKRAG